MYSMTGYGKGAAAAGGRTVTVELKSVNHRYLDIAVKLPKGFLFAEDAIKKGISARLGRGHVDVYLGYERKQDQGGQFGVDETLAMDYLSAANTLKALTGVTDDMSLSVLLRAPDIITRTQPEEDEEALLALSLQALDAALDGMTEMRAREGAQLKADISEKLDSIETALCKIKKLAPLAKEDYKNRLEAKIKEAVGNGFDESRILTEVAIFADRTAIDEETSRLTAHIAGARALCDAKEPMGRKLDFLVQEMNRETNTIGSKCNALDITREVLFIKNEIEKIREQAQNIE